MNPSGSDYITTLDANFSFFCVPGGGGWWGCSKKTLQDTDTTNQARTIYYRVDLPKVMDELQAWDENRAEGVITAILQVESCHWPEYHGLVTQVYPSCRCQTAMSLHYL